MIADNIVTILLQYCHNIGQIELSQSAPLISISMSKIRSCCDEWDSSGWRFYNLNTFITRVSVQAPPVVSTVLAIPTMVKDSKSSLKAQTSKKLSLKEDPHWLDLNKF